MSTDQVSGGTSSLDDSLSSRLAVFVDRLELRDVRCAHLSGEVFVDGLPEPEHVRVVSQTPRYMFEPERFAARFDHAFHFCNESGDDFARIEVAIVLDFELLDDDPPPRDSVIAGFIEHNAFFIAYPYLREAVHTTSTRLGIGPAVLGILRREDVRPRGVTIVRGGQFQLEEVTDSVEGTAN